MQIKVGAIIESIKMGDYTIEDSKSITVQKGINYEIESNAIGIPILLNIMESTEKSKVAISVRDTLINMSILSSKNEKSFTTPEYHISTVTDDMDVEYDIYVKMTITDIDDYSYFVTITLLSKLTDKRQEEKSNE